MRHKLDTTGECEQIERTSIKLFRELAKAEGLTLTASSKKKDMHEHWDFKISNEESEYTVDVKGAKKIDRCGPPDDRLILVEFTNNNGDKGWLRGKANYIAFLLKDGFYFVDRLDLLLHTYGAVKWFLPPTPSPSYGKSEYIVYQRSQYGKHDLVAYLTKEEIKELSSHFWPLTNPE